MGIGASGQQSAFSIWIRTGRQPIYSADGSVEFKFNPWHDPENGQFTLAGQGRYYGRSSGGRIKPGGGRFGGGGGSGGWTRSRKSPKSRSNSVPTTATAVSSSRDTGRVTVRATGSQANSQTVDLGFGETQTATSRETGQFRGVERNGYLFEIDDTDRTRRVSGEIILNDDQSRSRTAQAAAGGPDRRPTDDGGHYIARRFNGPKEAFNHFAQDARINRGKYRLMEEQWASAKRRGKRVTVKIRPGYQGQSQRPYEIDISYTIGSDNHSVKIPNER